MLDGNSSLSSQITFYVRTQIISVENTRNKTPTFLRIRSCGCEILIYLGEGVYSM